MSERDETSPTALDPRTALQCLTGELDDFRRGRGSPTALPALIGTEIGSKQCRRTGLCEAEAAAHELEAVRDIHSARGPEGFAHPVSLRAVESDLAGISGFGADFVVSHNGGFAGQLAEGKTFFVEAQVARKCCEKSADTDSVVAECLGAIGMVRHFLISAPDIPEARASTRC